MSKHLKIRVMDRLKSSGFEFVSLPAGSTPHKRGVHYFHTCAFLTAIRGAVDMAKEGRRCKKRIVVRPSRFRAGLHELYTYHFPTHWSAACVANRELIKEAQRQAHALEHDHSIEALEWRVRFFNHYFRVFKGGAKPEEGMKPYSRFYQYTYVAIYRQLQAEQKPHPDPLLRRGEKEYAHSYTSEEISFEPVSVEHPFRLKRHVIQAGRNTILEVFSKRDGEDWMASLPPPI